MNVEYVGVRSRWPVVVAAVVLFAASLAWRFLTFDGFSNDHYGHLALAQQVLLGDWPVRDFFDPGWPLTYLLSAVAWFVAGSAMGTEWALTAGALAIGAACTVAAAYRLSVSLPIAVLVTVIEILIHPRTYSYPKVLAYAVGACAMLAVASRPSPPRVLGMAAIVAIAFLFRHDHGLYIGVASAACVALASRAEGWQTAVRRVGALTTAVAVLLLPWILFVTLNGGLIAYFEGGIEFARAEANANALRSWPRFMESDRPTDDDGAPVDDTAPRSMPALVDDLRAAGTGLLARVPSWHGVLAYESRVNADAWLFWVFWSLPVLCGVIVCRRMLGGQERWPGECAAVAALVVLAMFVNAGFLRDILRTRLADAIVPAALLGAWALGLCWIGRWRRRRLQVLLQIVTLLVLGVSVNKISRVAQLPDRISNTRIGDGLDGMRERVAVVTRVLSGPHRQVALPPSRFSGALMPFFAYLDRCTARADRLIVTGEFPDVPVLAGRGFAGDGVVFGAWYSSTTHQERSIERIQARSVPFALLIGDYADFDLLDAYLTQEYEPMADIPVEGEASIGILVERSRSPLRIDPDTGWSCFR